MDRTTEVLELIRQIQRRHPGLRIGQIMSNVCTTYDVFYIEDDDLVLALKAYLDQHNRIIDAPSLSSKDVPPKLLP